jgi:hypothetical protein
MAGAASMPAGGTGPLVRPAAVASASRDPDFGRTNPWLIQPQLKQRLTLVQRPRPGTLRHRIAFTALAMLMGSTAFLAQAAAGHGEHAAARPSQDMAYVIRSAPIYPADAIKKKNRAPLFCWC